ncbi:MAG: class I SAM-dependent methyltransferase [Isosphaeraceae bacterium]|nr:class I SAM-dependent methyltransferase [Isosphaeraceae bacterium]
MDLAYGEAYRTLWERHWWWRSRERYLRSRLDRLASNGGLGRILDVGCGDGLFFDVLAGYGEVEGLETDGSLVRDPERRDRITVGTLETLSGERGLASFDVVLMLDVLEHIDDDRAALEDVFSLLGPGGRLVLTVPAMPWLWSRHDEVNEHRRRYTARMLREVIESAGFEIEELRPFFAWTILPMGLRRLLSPSGSNGRPYRVAIPPGPINRALIRLSDWDHALSTRVRLPWGSSLYAAAKRADESTK